MYAKFIKRIMDFFLALLALIVLSIPLLIIIVLLFISNKGAGVFFYQERPGYKAKIFKVIKFKSMTDECNAEGKLLPNEQRVTKIGAFIRKTSIDELPQLFNVLKGDMSFIGPRPLMVRYLDLYTPEQARRHNVRPGISGWAQINGRNNITWTKKFELDIWYVDHISLWLDIKILFLTIYKVCKRTNIDSSENKIGAVGFNGHN